MWHTEDLSLQHAALLSCRRDSGYTDCGIVPVCGYAPILCFSLETQSTSGAYIAAGRKYLLAYPTRQRPAVFWDFLDVRYRRRWRSVPYARQLRAFAFVQRWSQKAERHACFGAYHRTTACRCRECVPEQAVPPALFQASKNKA